MTDPIIVNLVSDPNWLDYLAAAATVASAGVLAWQAVQTRRSVTASEDMAEATRDTVKASQDAVEVAQAALRESQLARIESGFPRLFVTTSPYVRAVNVQTRVDTTDAMPWDVHEVDPAEVFKLPRDADRTLWIKHAFKVRNDGPGSVVIRNNMGVAWGAEFTGSVMGAGEEREGTVFLRHTDRLLDSSKQR